MSKQINIASTDFSFVHILYKAMCWNLRNKREHKSGPLLQSDNSQILYLPHSYDSLIRNYWRQSNLDLSQWDDCFMVLWLSLATFGCWNLNELRLNTINDSVFYSVTLITFQVLSSHMWPVSIVWYSAKREYYSYHRQFYWVAL